MRGYSEKAQPFLNAIADAVFTSRDTRDWLIAGTRQEGAYRGSSVLIEEQRAVRWRQRPTKLPFWANYWCGLDKRCVCRIDLSCSLETDAIFFFRNDDKVLAVHVEFKHPQEAFLYGQPEGYPLRAECFSKTWPKRRSLNPHHDWLTVLFCGSDSLTDEGIRCFDRVIHHQEAAKWIQAYPQI